MAGDWIKMRADLFTHPKVVRMSSALKADTLRTVGGLMSAWCLFDAHSEDGHLSGYSPEVLDAHLRWNGFSTAMMGVGWLQFSEEKGLSLPRFDTHNGASAKRRAQESDRKRAEREAEKRRPQDVGNLSAIDADKKRTREEKRREDRNTPIAPKGADARFDAFWAAYPSKVGKGAARKAWGKVKPDDALAASMLAALAWQKASDRWTKESGRYIPNPATWLNQGRWDDEAPADAEAKPWQDTRSGVEARGIDLGLGAWSETEQFGAYRSRVLKAHEQRAH